MFSTPTVPARRRGGGRSPAAVSAVPEVPASAWEVEGELMAGQGTRGQRAAHVHRSRSHPRAASRAAPVVSACRGRGRRGGRARRRRGRCRRRRRGGGRGRSTAIGGLAAALEGLVGVVEPQGVVDGTVDLGIGAAGGLGCEVPVHIRRTLGTGAGGLGDLAGLPHRHASRPVVTAAQILGSRCRSSTASPR